MSTTENKKLIQDLSIAIAYLKGCKVTLKTDPKARSQNASIRLAAFREISAIDNVVEFLEKQKASLK